MSLLPSVGGILGTMSPMAGMVTGKGLGQYLPYMSPAFLAGKAALGGGGGDAPQAPGAPVAAADAPAPPMGEVPQAPKLDGMEQINGALAANAMKPAAKPTGIISYLKQNPDISAALLRSGAQTLKSGIGDGILAGAAYVDQRRGERTANERYEREFGLKDRAQSADERRVENQGRQIGNEYELGAERNALTGRGQTLDYDATVRGQGVQERGNIRDNSTRLHGIDTDAAVTTRGQDVSSSTSLGVAKIGADASKYGADKGLEASKGDNVATVAAAAVNGTNPGDQSKAREAGMKAVGQLLPGMLGTNDVEGVARALQRDPTLQAELADTVSAAMASNPNNPMQAAQQAMERVLGKGAGYTDDNSWLPMHGDPEITRGQAGGAAAAPATPKPGDVVDGYQFLGGNPADPKSWRK
jgi:hypothetical protein